MKRKYILMSMIAAATLASCSKDDNDNKIDNNNNSVVEVEKTVENGVKETVENSVETISCPVTITVNKGNSISKLTVASDGKSAAFSAQEELKVYLASDNTRLGTLTLTNGAGTKEGTFSGNIQVQVTGTPENLSVYVEVGNAKVSGIQGIYTTLDGAVQGAAYLKSGQFTLTASTQQANGYASYSAESVALTDQTSYLVFASANNSASISINNVSYTVNDNYVLAFVGGTEIVSADLGLNFITVANKKYTYNLNKLKSIVIGNDVNKSFNFTSGNNSENFSVRLIPITVSSANIEFSSTIESEADKPSITANSNGYSIENKLSSGEYYLIAKVGGDEKGRWLVRVGRKTVTIGSLTLTYYSEQTWSAIKSNADNTQLGSYSEVNNYYVKFGNDYLKKGDNYVKVTDGIEENGSYTLVSDASSVTVNIEETKITFALGQTWSNIAETSDNISIDTDDRVKIDNKYLKNGDKYVKGSDVIDANGCYSFDN